MRPMSLNEASSSLRSSCSANRVVIQRLMEDATYLSLKTDLTAEVVDIRHSGRRNIGAGNLNTGDDLGHPFSDNRCGGSIRGSSAATPISKDLGLSPIALGYVFSSFLWTYTIFLVPMEMLVDRAFVIAVALPLVGATSILTLTRRSIGDEADIPSGVSQRLPTGAYSVFRSYGITGGSDMNGKRRRFHFWRMSLSANWIPLRRNMR